MPRHVRELGAGYLVSIIQPEFQPDTPPEILPERHLRVQVHDISEPQPGSVHPARDHIEQLIGFLTAWPVDAPLVSHCYAGISRSTAVALIALAMKTGSEKDAAAALRAAAPHAVPNRLIVTLADEILGLDGRLVAARDAMGEHQPAAQGPLVTLPVSG